MTNDIVTYREQQARNWAWALGEPAVVMPVMLSEAVHPAAHVQHKQQSVADAARP